MLFRSSHSVAVAVAEQIVGGNLVVHRVVAHEDLHVGATTVLEHLSADLVHTWLEINVTLLFFAAVETIVVDNEFIIDVEQGTVIRGGTEGPVATIWDLNPTLVDNSEAVFDTLVITTADVPVNDVNSEGLGWLHTINIGHLVEFIFESVHISGETRLAIGLVGECFSWDDLVWELLAHASLHLDGGPARTLKEVDADLVLASFELDILGLLNITVFTVVVDEEITVHVELGAIIRDETNLPVASSWNVNEASEHSADIVLATTGEDHLILDLVVDVIDDISIECLHLIEVWNSIPSTFEVGDLKASLLGLSKLGLVSSGLHG